MFTVDRTVPVNDPKDKSLPVLTRDQVWHGLKLKADNALPFVAAMTHCKVLSRDDRSLVREIELKGERMQERVTFFPKMLVVFERLSGPAEGAILNQVLDDVEKGLMMRFSFTFQMKGMPHGSQAERDFAAGMERDYLSAVAATVNAIRRLVTEGKIAA